MKRTMKIAITMVLVLFMCISSAAQNKDSIQKAHAIAAQRKQAAKDSGRNMVVTIAYHSGSTHSYELSLSKGHTVETGGYPGYFMQYGAGVELFYKDKTVFAAPKIAYELDPYLPPICLSRMNLLYVTDFKKNGSLKYRHEIGFSLIGIVNINYGYTFSITHKEFCSTTHSINLQWNLFVGKRKVDMQRD